MGNTKREKVEELIKQGKHVKSINFVKVDDSGVLSPGYVSGEEYDLWMNKVKIFASKYCKDHTLYDDIMNAYKTRKNSWGTEAYDDVMSYLNSLLSDDEFVNNLEVGSTNNVIAESKKLEKMIFISHSSLDLDYVNVLVELLEDIGFRGKSTIFCSSVSGYGIPMGRHIYDYLKEQFNKELHVIYLLSENYYNSPACLNEMGAAWVKSKHQTAILTPEFNYNQIRGAVDASRIWFRLNDKDKISEFKDELLGEFGLEDLENDFWERKKDKYLTDVSKIYESNKHKTSSQAIEFEGIEENYSNVEYICFFRFINRSDSSVRCTYIDLEISDSNGGKIKINLTPRQLGNMVIYNNENKRVKVIIPRNSYEIISGFNPYIWSKYDLIDSRWSMVL